MQLLHDQKGQAGITSAVGLQVSLIVTLLISVVIIYQIGIANIGPTDCTLIDNASGANVVPNPAYDAIALAQFSNVKTLSWAGIGLMAIAIIVLAASVILSIVRQGMGGV
jgi:hypothetical protein